MARSDGGASAPTRGVADADAAAVSRQALVDAGRVESAGRRGAGVLKSLVTTTPFRIVASTLGMLVATGAAIFGLLFWQSNALLSEQVVAGLRADADAIIAEGRVGGLPALVEAVATRSRVAGSQLYLLTDLRGARLAGNLPALPPELTEKPTGGIFQLGPRGGVAPRLAFGLSVDTGVGARLLVGRDIDGQRQYARRMQRAFLVGFGLMALVGLAGGVLISRRVLARIGAITDTSRSIMAGDLSRRVPLSGAGDELDDLAGNLNDMLGRIELLMASMREVSDNIAHDLKTPLTRLRTRAEAALRDGREAGQYREALERTIEEADDLIKTFNALLLIARLEAGALEQSMGPVDLGAVVYDAAELYEPLAEERGLSLTVEAAEGVQVRGNRQLIGQAVANMIDNAIKYSAKPGAGGPITVRLVDGSGGPEITVGDRGPGIAPEDRARALKRFVRLDSSRTQPGTGLGLSLVAAVARLHGGTIRLEDNAPGLRIVFVMPPRV